MLIASLQLDCTLYERKLLEASNKTRVQTTTRITAVTRTHIRWTQDEQRRVAQRAAEIRLTEFRGELECWRQAQKVLPENRRRRIESVSLISASMRSVYEELLSRPQPEPTPKPEAVVEEQPPELPQTTVDDLLELLADSIAEKFITALRRSIQQQLAQIQPLIQDFPQPIAPVRVPRRTVLIVGLLPAQAELIKNRFQDRWDLRFVSSQETAQTIALRAGNSEKVLLMTNFIQHSHQQAAVQLKGRENVVLITGGLSSLTKRLEAL